MKDIMTGTSANDACVAINSQANPKSGSADFTRVGSIFPSSAKSKGTM